MLDKTKIYVVDFEDSFTFNIATELYIYEKDIQVIAHNEFFADKTFKYFFNDLKQKTAVILGPGPGSPDEYRDYFSKIRQLKNNPKIFLMGICLGHQLLALIDGLSIRPSARPVHGRQVKINFNNLNMLVQRYNSLAVYESKKSSEEIQVREWGNGISYQFHPESIGTENRPLFFKALIDFLIKK